MTTTVDELWARLAPEMRERFARSQDRLPRLMTLLGNMAATMNEIAALAEDACEGDDGDHGDAG